MKLDGGICVRCGNRKEDHFSPWKYPGELYCSDDPRRLASYLEAVPTPIPPSPQIPLKIKNKRESKPALRLRGGGPMAYAIRNLRRRTGLSQGDFAEQSGITRPTLGSYEEGRADPKLKAIYRMTKLAGVSLDQFCQIIYDRDGSKA